ncbi:hypothetical protein FLP10_04730 [Agromyces intestinalis]|uniref:Type I restriction modification DNA specificity domain-containing protein n=1 Tax=Agromyces intestinalis TaxID=2592652 RepID=A0A5C1YED7_9MICO|nr:restriction endonuclease subunit S [Agromyces intestinalis]QEO13805.1 hypothetical protein FLP10_04730 [Agromyces intestinalis]
MSWPTVRVGDIARLNYGKALKADARQPGKVQVFGSGGVVGSHDSALVDGKSIIVGRKGSIGSIWYTEASSWAIDTAYYIDESSSQADLKWLYWTLKSLRLGEMNKSAAIPGLNRDDVYRLAIPLPPLPEQRRIVAILDQADALLSRRRTSIAAVEALNSQLIDNLLDQVSETRRLGDLAELITKGATPTTLGFAFSESGIPLVRVQNLVRGRVDTTVDAKFIDHRTHDALGRSKIRPGDVLISIAGTVGRAALVRNSDPEMNCNQAVAIVRLTDHLDPAWLAAWLNSRRGQTAMNGSAVTATISNLSLGSIANLRVPMPTARRLDEFRTVISRSETARRSLTVSANHLDTLFASLQHRAFRGEL